MKTFSTFLESRKEENYWLNRVYAKIDSIFNELSQYRPTAQPQQQAIQPQLPRVNNDQENFEQNVVKSIRASMAAGWPFDVSLKNSIAPVVKSMGFRGDVDDFIRGIKNKDWRSPNDFTDKDSSEIEDIYNKFKNVIYLASKQPVVKEDVNNDFLENKKQELKNEVQMMYESVVRDNTKNLEKTLGKHSSDLLSKMQNVRKTSLDGKEDEDTAEFNLRTIAGKLSTYNKDLAELKIPIKMSLAINEPGSRPINLDPENNVQFYDVFEKVKKNRFFTIRVYLGKNIEKAFSCDLGNESSVNTAMIALKDYVLELDEKARNGRRKR